MSVQTLIWLLFRYVGIPKAVRQAHHPSSVVQSLCGWNGDWIGGAGHHSSSDICVAMHTTFPRIHLRISLATILSQDIASRICVFVVGFEAGFFVRKSVDWFRYWAIRRLLSYQEWIYGSKSWKNRVSMESRITVFHKFIKFIQI